MTLPVQTATDPLSRFFGRLIVILGTAAVALATVFSILWCGNQADVAWRGQLDLAHFEQNAARVNGNEWRAMARREVDPELAAELAQDKKEMMQTVATMRRDPNRGQDIDAFVIAATDYVQAIDHELNLLEDDRYAEALEVDAQEVDPQYDKLEQMIASIQAKHRQLIRTVSRQSEIGLILIVAFSAGFINFLLMHSERVKRRETLALAERAGLRQSEKRFRTLTEKSGDIIVILGADFTVKYVSSSVYGLLGLETTRLKGRDLTLYVRPRDLGRLKALMDVSMAKDEAAAVELQFRHANGSFRYFECICRNLTQDPSIAGLVLNLREITTRKEAQQELLFNAGHDALTGLPNRALFLERLQGVIDRTARHPEQCAAVLFIDLDDFKVVNESLGHEAGDELIVELGKRITASLRSSDTVGRLPSAALEGEALARMGGDEFTVLLEDVRDPGDVMRVAQRIREVVEQPFSLRGHRIHRSACIGVATASAAVSAEDLVRNADIAMHRAKNNGKSRCELFDSNMHAQVMGRLQTEADLRQALERQEFRLYYQPIVTLATGVVEGFEALVRWQRPDRGLVSPGEFIGVAEDTGLIVPLGEWILTEAARQAVAWPNLGGLAGQLYISVNISGKQFSRPGFLDQVRGALERSGLPPSLLKLELTESVAMDNAPRTEQILREVKHMGVRLSIDDFGTGYSSLSYLRRFPIHTLKIDKSFVLNMRDNNEATAIVRTIVALARSLQMEVVAEGVETAEQLDQLKAMVCDAAQGYFFAAPMPAAQSLDFLATHESQPQARAAAAGNPNKR